MKSTWVRKPQAPSSSNWSHFFAEDSGYFCRRALQHWPHQINLRFTISICIENCQSTNLLENSRGCQRIVSNLSPNRCSMLSFCPSLWCRNARLIFDNFFPRTFGHERHIFFVVLWCFPNSNINNYNCRGQCESRSLPPSSRWRSRTPWALCWPITLLRCNPLPQDCIHHCDILFLEEFYPIVVKSLKTVWHFKAPPSLQSPPPTWYLSPCCFFLLWLHGER